MTDGHTRSWMRDHCDRCEGSYAFDGEKPHECGAEAAAIFRSEMAMERFSGRFSGEDEKPVMTGWRYWFGIRNG
jgi:hypothetical protein